MRKIVINKCYGGFGLSLLAQQKYAKLKGFELFFYTQTKYKHNEKIDEYKKVKKDDESFCIYPIKKDLGDTINKFPNNLFFNSEMEIKRDDKDLVIIVEKLGKKANGRHADLSIVEIPDDINWKIEEYDGNESIEEVHRSWS